VETIQGGSLPVGWLPRTLYPDGWWGVVKLYVVTRRPLPGRSEPLPPAIGGSSEAALPT